jgi:hypothetical protein
VKSFDILSGVRTRRTHQDSFSATMPMPWVISLAHPSQYGIRPPWLATCSINPVLNSRARQLLENNGVFFLHDFDQIPGAHLPTHSRMFCTLLDLTPEKRAKPVVVYGIAGFMQSCPSLVRFFIANPFLLSAFRA